MKALALVVGVDDLAKMVSSSPANERGTFGEAGQNRAMIIDPACLDMLKAHFQARYNNMAGVTRGSFHVITASRAAGVKALPELPLGLPGRYEGMTLRSLMEHFCAPKDGWVRCFAEPASRGIDLPVHAPKPSYVEPVPRVNRGCGAAPL